jgi:predicted RNA-binding protein YlxR (DUF448 family)
MGKAVTPVTPNEPLDADSLNPVDPRERRCILSGERGSPDGLLRLALAPDGAIVPDVAEKLPGRGAWVSLDKALLQAAVATGRIKAGLARAFKASPASFVVAPDLAHQIEALLKARALSRLGLEAKAGHLLFGADVIEQAARAGRVHLLLHAADAAEDGRRKLGRPGLPALELPATRAEIGLALGREHVVHAAASDPRAATRVAREVGRWRQFAGDRSAVRGS